MAVFQWRGIDARGKDVKGMRDADNPSRCAPLLRKEGILATADRGRRRRAHAHAARDRLRALFQRVSVQDVAIMTRQLATLLRAGVPLVECLSALIEQVEQPKLKSALTQIRDKVNEGTSLADALERAPEDLPAAVREHGRRRRGSGTLEAVLERLADFLEAQAQLRGKVSGALAYPGFMVLFGIALIALMMVVVVPKVTTIFEGFNATAALVHATLIFVSHAFGSFWWLIFGVLARRDLLLPPLAARPRRAARPGTSACLKLPIFGQLRADDRGRALLAHAVDAAGERRAAAARDGHHAQRARQRRADAGGRGRARHRSAKARASPHRSSAAARFPPIVTHMIAIGERSGQLEQMLNTSRSPTKARSTHASPALTSLLEPLMIVVMGAMAGSIALSILMPLMQINEFVQ